MKEKPHIASLFTVVLSILILCPLFNLNAQDVHFTQFTLQGMQQSPAQAGNFDGNHRFAVLYRNQWATAPVPYNSMAFAYDVKAYQSKKLNSSLNTGMYSFFDQAGDGRFKTLYVQVPLSYRIQIPMAKSGQLILGAGLYTGFFSKSIQYNYLQFDNQFAGEGFDPNLPNNESFNNLNLNKFDLGAGGLLGFSFQNKVYYEISLGLHHLNKIEESFIDNGLHLILQKRYALSSKIQYNINKKWGLEFDYLYQKQHVKQEHLFGLLVRYYIKNKGAAQTAIDFGTYYRVKDAVSGIFRFKYNNILLGLSYDTNISHLKPASNTYGGIEIGLVYEVKKVKTPEIKGKRACFVF